MKGSPGRVRKRLAKKLQHQFPTTDRGLPLTWSPENLYPATGAHRTDALMDCAAWEGVAMHVRDDGTWHPCIRVHGYMTMTRLLRARRLSISPENEVFDPGD
jgi:hypothetical protein